MFKSFSRNTYKKQGKGSAEFFRRSDVSNDRTFDVR